MRRGRGEKIQRGEYEKQYGFELSVIRKRKGYKQEDIAKHIGITPQQYQKYECGSSKISIGTEEKIAEFFGIKRSELVKKIEEEINEKII